VKAKLALYCNIFISNIYEDLTYKNELSLDVIKQKFS